MTKIEAIKEIKNYMIDKLSCYDPLANGGPKNEWYDDTRHCGDLLWIKVQDYWQNIFGEPYCNPDNDIIYLLSGKWYPYLGGRPELDECVDLNGGRNYFLSDEKLHQMLFDYLIFNLNYTKNQFNNIIYNTTDLSDMINYLYDNNPKYVIRHNQISKILK